MPHPAPLKFAVLAADVVVFAVERGVFQTLLINVDRPPHFRDVPGFPGGLIRPEETAEAAARRQLAEKGGLDPKKVYLEQLYTFSGIDRDPRGRVVSVAYLGLTSETKLAGTEYGPHWLPVTAVPTLAYDHNDMLAVALERLRGKLEYTNIIARLMPSEFTLTQLQRVYETILGRALDKRNFRKKLLDVGAVKATGKFFQEGAHRPAELYRFTSKEVRTLELV